MPKITSGGRITIPVEIRRALDLNAGDKVQFERSDAGLSIRKWRPNAEPTPVTRSPDGFGAPLTIDEVQSSIEQASIDGAPGLGS